MKSFSVLAVYTICMLMLSLCRLGTTQRQHQRLIGFVGCGSSAILVWVTTVDLPDKADTSQVTVLQKKVKFSLSTSWRCRGEEVV